MKKRWHYVIDRMKREKLWCFRYWPQPFGRFWIWVVHFCYQNSDVAEFAAVPIGKVIFLNWRVRSNVDPVQPRSSWRRRGPMLRGSVLTSWERWRPDCMFLDEIKTTFWVAKRRAKNGLCTRRGSRFWVQMKHLNVPRGPQCLIKTRTFNVWLAFSYSLAAFWFVLDALVAKKQPCFAGFSTWETLRCKQIK